MRLIPYLLFALALVGFVWFGVALIAERSVQAMETALKVNQND